jgi:hypothetical protein
MEQNRISHTDYIFADSAEPDRIATLGSSRQITTQYADTNEEVSLYVRGFNVLPAKKDVKAGIDFIKGKKIHVCNTSLNLIKEYNTYRYKETKDGIVLDEPIKNIQQAKEYFIAMGCSHFHMAREYPHRYEEYKQFNITKQMESEWRMEQLEDYYKNIMEDDSSNPLWIVHSNMSELTEILKTDITLIKMLEATKHIQDKVPLIDRVIVSETINGRRYREARSGLIYLAYDLNRIQIAKSFVELSFHFATYVKNKTRDFDRCQAATQLCNNIKLELGL